jgi:hypothetical protein
MALGERLVITLQGERRAVEFISTVFGVRIPRGEWGT